MKTKFFFTTIVLSIYSFLFAEDKYIYNASGEKIYYIEVKDTTFADDFVSDMKTAASVSTSKELLCLVDSSTVWTTNKILLQIKDGYDINAVLQEYGVSFSRIERIGSNPNNYIVELNGEDVFECSNVLYESGKFMISEPSFIRKVIPNNTYYKDQWSLYDANAGINAEQAWQYSSGQNITVAVLDFGFYAVHEDLKCNIVGRYNVITDDNNVTSPLEEYIKHGTQCAGIIAACDNNIGIKGVAYNSALYLIKTFNNTGYTSDEYVIKAFERAFSVADVISCSWQYNQYSSMLVSEIVHALYNGRQGKGCVVVFSSGNDNKGEVNFPAKCDDGIITVGAIDKNTKRIVRENLIPSEEEVVKVEIIGSNYGDKLDVVAPGDYIWSTDENNQYNSINMTSAAAPHVSGIAALVLSVNPKLTSLQVQSIINSTCRKLPDYSFSNNSSHPDGSWNKEVGYGLVDATAAVKKAIEQISIIGPDLICDEATYILSAFPAGATVNWSYEGYDMGLVVHPLLVTKNNEGSATYKRGSEMDYGPIKPPFVQNNELGNAGEESMAQPVSMPTKPYTGVQVITATINLNGQKVVLKKTVNVGTINKPILYYDGAKYDPSYGPMVNGKIGKKCTFSCNNINVQNIRWDISVPGVGKISRNATNSVTVTPTAGGILSVKLINTAGCSDDNFVGFGLIIDPIFTIDPINPVNPGQCISASVWIEGSQQETQNSECLNAMQSGETERVPYEGSYIVELWSETYGLISRHGFDTPNAQIPTNTIQQPGVYYLRLVIDGQLKATNKVIIL